MKMICSVIALACLLIGCKESEPQASARLDESTCPQCRGRLSHVPHLVSGVPTKEMADKMYRGEALLAGCVGDPNNPELASVCLKCRTWKTHDMKYWQPLPKQFGTRPKGMTDS